MDEKLELIPTLSWRTQAFLSNVLQCFISNFTKSNFKDSFIGLLRDLCLLLYFTNIFTASTLSVYFILCQIYQCIQSSDYELAVKINYWRNHISFKITYKGKNRLSRGDSMLTNNADV